VFFAFDLLHLDGQDLGGSISWSAECSSEG
jgi:hypothetical protein